MPRARIATWVDAWRGEVYTALYDDARPLEHATVESPDRALRRFAGRRIVFAGDGAATYAGRIHAALGDAAAIIKPAAPLLAGTVARLAEQAVRSGHRPPPEAIRPLYVRRPDAELARDVGLAR